MDPKPATDPNLCLPEPPTLIGSLSYIRINRTGWKGVDAEKQPLLLSVQGVGGNDIKGQNNGPTIIVVPEIVEEN